MKQSSKQYPCFIPDIIVGEDGKQDFHPHSKVTWIWGLLCRELDCCPTLKDRLDYYMNGRTIEKSRKGMEYELNFVADVLNKDGIQEEKKEDAL